MIVNLHNLFDSPDVCREIKLRTKYSGEIGDVLWIRRSQQSDLISLTFFSQNLESRLKRLRRRNG
jgi:hypothetical protein